MSRFWRRRRLRHSVSPRSTARVCFPDANPSSSQTCPKGPYFGLQRENVSPINAIRTPPPQRCVPDCVSSSFFRQTSFSSSLGFYCWLCSCLSSCHTSTNTSTTPLMAKRMKESRFRKREKRRMKMTLLWSSILDLAVLAAPAVTTWYENEVSLSGND